MLEGLLLLKVLISFSSFRGVEITHEGESIQLVNPFEIVAKDAVPMEVRLCSPSCSNVQIVLSSG